MSQIGTLAAAPAITIFQGQAKCDQYILIGEVGDELPIESITVEIDGRAFLLIQTQALIQAFAKWQMEVNTVSANLGSLIKIATGQIKKNTTYRFTNVGATTPPIYVFSEAPDGVPLEVASMQINPNSNETYEAFSALFIDAAGAISTLDFVFTSGHVDTLTFAEAAALFNLRFSAEDNGLVTSTGAVLIIDNTDQSIASVRVNTGAASVDVLTAKIPDAAFAEFQKRIK